MPCCKLGLFMTRVLALSLHHKFSRYARWTPSNAEHSLLSKSGLVVRMVPNCAAASCIRIDQYCIVFGPRHKSVGEFN